MWENGASLPPSGIEQQYRSLRKVVEAGRTYMGVVHRTDQQGLLYAWAMAALMGGAEHSQVRVGNQTAYGSVAPSYRPELDMVLGEPGPLQHVTGSTLWQRSYSGGYTLRADTVAQVATLS